MLAHLSSAEILRKLNQAKMNLSKIELKDSLKDFFIAAWPILEKGKELHWNWHLGCICEELENLKARTVRRTIINVPFRTLKSTLVNVAFPAWVWTDEPWVQFLCLSHAEDLALRDAVRMRDLVLSDWYQARWPMQMSKDQNSKFTFVNDKGGHRISQSITAGLTGKGGDIILIDDPHDTEKVESDALRKATLSSFDSKVITRQNEPARSAIGVVAQRTHHRDLTGHVLNTGAEPWSVVCFPMEYDPDHPHVCKDDPRTEPGELLDPIRIPLKEVKALKIQLGSYRTAGQLNQRPSVKGGGIIRYDDWQIWPNDVRRPAPIFRIHSYDTAFKDEDIKTAAYSAMTGWDVFVDPKDGLYSVIMYTAWRDRVDFPALLDMALKFQEDEEPDFILVEEKASGISLIQYLRRMRLPVRTHSPQRGDDKTARAYRVQPHFEAGRVYRLNKRWLEPPVQECAEFPNSEYSDWTDTITQAIYELSNMKYVGEERVEDRTVWDRRRDQSHWERQHQRRGAIYG